MELDLYTQTGEKKGQIKVNKEVFGNEINEALIHEALIRQLSNQRYPIANTLTRAEVRGGGRKPYAQKHTGRARQGSIRAPHYIGGGVTFGPRSATRNFKKNMPKKQRRKALLSMLSAKFNEKQVLALEEIVFEGENPKTKMFSEMIKKLPIERNALIVLSEKNKEIQQAGQNLSKIKTILVNYLNIDDLLKYEKVIFLKDALPKIETIFSLTK